MQYKDKLKQANREAKAACIGLCGTIIVWALCGFGVSCFNMEICSVPLWIITGCGGTFLFAVGVSLWMACFVMKDVGLEDEGTGVIADSNSAGATVNETVDGVTNNAFSSAADTSVNKAAHGAPNSADNKRPTADKCPTNKKA